MPILSIPDHGPDMIPTSSMLKYNHMHGPPLPPPHMAHHTTGYDPTTAHLPQYYNNTQNPPIKEPDAKIKELLCEYIDYLIEENEQLTQISRAYTVPTPLDFENEHYFDEVRNADHPFPSERFRLWLEMKEYENYHIMNSGCDYTPSLASEHDTTAEDTVTFTCKSEEGAETSPPSLQ